MGRHAANEETREFELNGIYSNIKDYGGFKATMDQYLVGKKIDKDIYNTFISIHLASPRAAYIEKCI